MATIKRQKKRPPSSSKKTTQIKFNPLRVFIRLVFLLIIWGTGAAGILLVYETTQLPDISKIDLKPRSAGIRLIASNGVEFASFGDLYKKPISFEKIPRNVIHALLATEDRRFYDHFGLDPISIIRAMAVNLRTGSIKQGGSTLTQQLAKNLFLNPRRSFRRKVQELLLAFWLELSFKKDQILTIYLNRVYFGSGTYGLQAASHHYFNKSVEFLTLYDSALLVGLLKAPSRYNPIANPGLAQKRTSQVLVNMVNAEFLTQIEADLAFDSKSTIARAVVRGSGHRYFADWVRDRAVAYSGYIAKDRKVYTTFNPKLQQQAEKSIAAGLRRGSKKGVQQAAMVVLDKKGAVLAMVGGKSYTNSQFNRATQALRQPGSALKPLVYLAALNEGYTPSSIILDTPLTIGSWSPKNFDGRFRKNVTLSEALVMSLNVPTVRLSESIGRQHSIDLARKLGITSELKNEPSLALGANEVTLLELTSAYVAFSNGGHPISPYGIENVTVPGEGIIYKNQVTNQPSVAKAEKIEMIHELLSDVIRSGTGKRAFIENDAAGKTGTSQDYRDAWFIGYSGNLIAGIWLGRDDSKSMAKVTGGGLPAEIWSNFMQKATAITN